jgi:hypothetical protein
MVGPLFAPRRWRTVASLRRPALAALVLALGGLAAVPRRTASERRAVPRLAIPDISLAPLRPPPEGPPGQGERSEPGGTLYLGAMSARGALSLGVVEPGVGPPGVTLWPPAPVWPSVRDGVVQIEHGLLAPTTSYRLDLAWPDGRSWQVRFETRPLYEVIERGPGAGRIDPSSPVWARFGVDVDRASVEAAFRMEPPVEGAFRWLDDRTVQLQPARPLSYGTLHRATVGGRGRDGAPLRPSTWAFRPLIPPPMGRRRCSPSTTAPTTCSRRGGCWSCYGSTR